MFSGNGKFGSLNSSAGAVKIHSRADTAPRALKGGVIQHNTGRSSFSLILIIPLSPHPRLHIESSPHLQKRDRRTHHS